MTGSEVVVFDVDDTLYLERDYVKSGFRAVGDWLTSARGVDGFSDVAWQVFLEGVRGKIFNQALERLGVADDLETIRTLIEVYRHHTPDITLLPDAHAAITQAHARGKVAVITDGPVASQERKVKALGLERWASPIICTWRAGRAFGKPHVRAFQEVEAATGARGDALVYVADNPTKDFVGPKALGWRTLRIRRPGGLNTDIPSGDDVDVECEGTLSEVWA